MEPPLMQTTDRGWEVAAHLSGLLMFTALPFGNILGPLLVWLIKRSSSPSVEAHAREALNFQISLTLYFFAAVAGCILLMFVLIGFLLLPLVIAAVTLGALLNVILMVLAAIRAGNGEMYRYPLTIRFI